MPARKKVCFMQPADCNHYNCSHTILVNSANCILFHMEIHTWFEQRLWLELQSLQPASARPVRAGCAAA